MCIICNNWVCIYNWLKTIYCLSGHWSGLVTPNWVYSPSVLVVVQSGPVGLTLSYTINSSFAPGQQPESTYTVIVIYMTADPWPDVRRTWWLSTTSLSLVVKTTQLFSSWLARLLFLCLSVRPFVRVKSVVPSATSLTMRPTLVLSSNLPISSLAFFNTESRNSVGRSRGAWCNAARVSCFRLDFSWAKYESLLQRVMLAMETKVKSDRCSMALAYTPCYTVAEVYRILKSLLWQLLSCQPTSLWLVRPVVFWTVPAYLAGPYYVDR